MDDLNDRRNRLVRTRWPDKLSGVDSDYGVPLGYDWRRHEAALNALAPFATEIDG